MTQFQPETLSFWRWTQRVLHAKPYIWSIINDFEPRLSCLGIHLATEKAIALLWAIMDVAYLPVLVSLGSIIEPLLNLNQENRTKLHRGIYFWTFAVVLYRIRWVWSSFDCHKLSLLQAKSPALPPEEFQCAIAIVPLLVVSFSLFAGMAGYLVFWAGTRKRDRGPLHNIVVLGFSVATAGVCFYPLAVEMVGGI